MQDPAKFIWQPTHFISMGFGAGLIPIAPGTFGTMVAVPLFWLMRYFPWWHYLLIVFLCMLLGFVVCDATAKALGVHDHQSIVWDEVVGYLVTMTVVPVAASWQWLLLGFVLFRLFDIAKPWPIKWIDQRVRGGLGIMLDDVAAGIAAALVLLLVRYSGFVS